MDGGGFDLEGEVERAWTRFRGRLADRLAALEDDDCLMLELEAGADEDDLRGAAPYLQFMGWGGDLVRSEVVSNAFLDERFRLDDEAQARLGGLGWRAPTCRPGEEDDSGSVNFHLDVEVREADRLAVMAVRALREVFGCAHPVFLDADGLEADPEPQVPARGLDEDPEEPVAEFPESAEDLRGMVDRALAVMMDAPLRHDEDGDVPVVAGESAVFVRVGDERPGIELYSELVVDVTDTDRAVLEVGILNLRHPFAKFVLRDDLIVMSYRFAAFPFAAAQLRAVLGVMMDSLDDIARDLALRVGGRRFFEPVREVVTERPVPVRPDPSPALVGLLEMLYDGPARPQLVAALFDDDRHEIIRQLVRLRTGVDDAGEHDPELVLAHLRAALRYVADPPPAPPTRRTLPPRPPRTHQLALLPDREDTLDLEESS